MDPDKLRLRPHDADELSHYSSGTSDVEFLFPWGWDELEGIANRGDYDLTAHAAASGERLEYFDQTTNEHYVPHVIEPAAGATRTMMAFLMAAYDEEEVNDETRTVLRLHPRLAPYKVAVLPLSKKDTLSPVAREVFGLLAPHMSTDYDETQAIGRRYRRQDEVGTPYCVTVDFDTLEDRAVTVRERDSMEQERVAIDHLLEHLRGGSADPGVTGGCRAGCCRSHEQAVGWRPARAVPARPALVSSDRRTSLPWTRRSLRVRARAGPARVVSARRGCRVPIARPRPDYAARKRLRYSVGLVRTTRRKVRRIVSAVPKPAVAATASTPSSVSSRRRRAVSTRTRSTKRAGVTPTSSVKQRAKCRSLMAATRARAATLQSDSGCSTTWRCASRRPSRSAIWAASWALNCDWLAGRRRNSTRWRATASATSRPRSSSTSARDRSMPAVTPAEV